MKAEHKDMLYAVLQVYNLQQPRIDIPIPNLWENQLQVIELANNKLDILISDASAFMYRQNCHNMLCSMLDKAGQ